MKSSIKIKGKLKTILYLPLVMTMLLVLFNVLVYVEDVKVGAMFSGFVVLYFALLLINITTSV